jgi:hypothetical protein
MQKCLDKTVMRVSMRKEAFASETPATSKAKCSVDHTKEWEECRSDTPIILCTKSTQNKPTIEANVFTVLGSPSETYT